MDNPKAIRISQYMRADGMRLQIFPNGTATISYERLYGVDRLYVPGEDRWELRDYIAGYDDSDVEIPAEEAMALFQTIEAPI